jgi:hypothetical protein
MSFRQTLMACSAFVGAWLLMPATASAQSASEAEKIRNLERQTELLQMQLKELKGEIARMRAAPAAPVAVAAAGPVAVPVAGAAAPPPGEYVKGAPPPPPGGYVKGAVAPPPPAPRVKITVGGFIAAESVWRSRNEVADIGSNFGGIPYPFSPLFNENEFHGTARQSRISLLVEGNIDPWQKLTGYYETDFLGVGNTSNYNQSNSWAPRLRQAFVGYDNSGWGFHFLAGQAWSLATQNQAGIVARKENIPLTIDANYVVGFNYDRNWQIRAVQEFGPVTLGVSVEAPAAIIAASTATAPTGAGGAFASGGLVNGLVVNFNNPGGSFLTGATITTDQAPDIIEKAAFDPGWGHYEVYGIQRWFTDNVLNCINVQCVAGSTTQIGSPTSKTAFGAGVGGSVLLPLIPKYLELTASALWGQGVGRYAAGQLPDVTIGIDGSLKPLTGLSAMVGLIGHPWDGLDVYAYAGIEQVDGSFFGVGNNLFGYGNPGFSNAGCVFATPSSFAGATPATCIANNRRLGDITAGFWQNVYKGDYGRVAVGAQYEYIKRESFQGIGGTVSTDDNIVLTSIRYYPQY